MGRTMWWKEAIVLLMTTKMVLPLSQRSMLTTTTTKERTPWQGLNGEGTRGPKKGVAASLETNCWPKWWSKNGGIKKKTNTLKVVSSPSQRGFLWRWWIGFRVYGFITRLRLHMQCGLNFASLIWYGIWSQWFRGRVRSKGHGVNQIIYVNDNDEEIMHLQICILFIIDKMILYLKNP